MCDNAVYTFDSKEDLSCTDLSNKEREKKNHVVFTLAVHGSMRAA